MERFFGDVTQHRRRVQPNLRALRLLQGRIARCAVEPHHVVERRGEVRPAESFGDDAVHMRNDSVHAVASVHPDNRADADRRVERGPEVEFVRRVGPTLRRDNSAEDFGHAAP